MEEELELVSYPPDDLLSDYGIGLITITSTLIFLSCMVYPEMSAPDLHDQLVFYQRQIVDGLKGGQLFMLDPRHIHHLPK